ELIKNVAATSTTVLIEGEPGIGKEEVARAIHQASTVTRTGPMVAVRCAALPPALLEQELFGHDSGTAQLVPLELAHGGTLFLDEVSALPAALQAKLLWVLKERRFD